MRTTAIVTAAVAIALLVVTGVALSVRRTQLEHALDRDLTRRVVEAEGAIRDGDLGPAVVQAAAGDRFAQVVQSPGVVVAASSELTDVPLPVVVPRPDRTALASVEARVDGRTETVRLAARAVAAPSGIASSTVVVVGAPLDGTADQVGSARAALLLLVAVMVVAAGAAAWRVTGRRRPDRGTGPAAAEGQMS